MPKGFAFPTNEELWLPLYSEFPPKPRNDPRAINPAVLGLLEAGRLARSGQRRSSRRSRGGFAAAYPDTNKQFNTGQVQPLIEDLHAAPAARHAADDARVLRRRAAHRVRQRDEHAVRARDAARQGAGGPVVARRDADAADPADAHREPAGRRHRRRRRHRRSRTASIDWLSATVRNLENPPPAWITFDVDAPVLRVHGRRDGRCRGAVRACCRRGCRRARTPSRSCATAAAATRAAASSLVSRGLVVFQIVVTCVLLIGSLLQLRSITEAADDRLRLRHRRASCRRAWA